MLAFSSPSEGVEPARNQVLPHILSFSHSQTLNSSISCCSLATAEQMQNYSTETYQGNKHLAIQDNRDFVNSVLEEEAA